MATKRRTYKLRADFSDGIPRAGIGVFLDLTRNQVAALEGLAGASGTSLKAYLSELGRTVISQLIPPEKE